MLTDLDEAMQRHPSSGQLQEIIASNSVRAFNNGVEHGAIQERERLISLLESQIGAYEDGAVTMDDGLLCAIALLRGTRSE